MKRDTSVRPYSSVGCPATLGYNSDLKTVLDACIAGYGEVSVQSITVAAGGVATIETAVAHQFFQWEVVRIAGSSDAAWNTDWKIESIVSPTVFTVLTDFGQGSVGGTITAKVAPLIHLTKNSDVYALSELAGVTISITNSSDESLVYNSMVSYPARLKKASAVGDTAVPWYLTCNSKNIIMLCIPPSDNTQYGFTIRTRYASPAFYANTWCQYDNQFRDPSASLYPVKPGLSWLSTVPTYIGESGTLMSSTGINPIDGKRVYFPVYLAGYWSAGGQYQYASVLSGMYIPVGLKPANGIYEEMLHFSGSNGYGFCIDLRGPWYGT